MATASADINALSPFPIVVVMQDEIVHDITHPFCSDPTCPCKSDEDLIINCLVFPCYQEVLTPEEARGIWRGEQAVPLYIVAYDG